MFRPAAYLATAAATLQLALSAHAQTRAGAERDEMFKGHCGWRGLLVFAVPTIGEAKKLVATDPVTIKDEMVAEYHKYHGSAALMLVKGAHAKITKKRFRARLLRAGDA